MRLVRNLILSILWVSGIAVSFSFGTAYGIVFIILTGVIAIRRDYEKH